MAKQVGSPGLNTPQITILSDHPILDKNIDKGEDLLKVDNKLIPILDILRHKNTQCPMTIGIIGKWGTGKSSAMKWLENELSHWNGSNDEKRNGHPKVYPVWFAPWKYTNREDVWRGIIAEIILKCVAEVGSNSPDLARQLLAGAKNFGRFLGKSFISALANTSLKIGDTVEISGELFREISDEYHKEIHPEKAYLNDFETTLHKWISDYIKPRTDKHPGERMVVFIDDLDRCLPEVTLEVLEAMKLYLNIPQLIFVIGLDREVVDAVVTEHYKKQGLDQKKSAEYLNKIFQIDFHIEPSQVQIEDFFTKQFELFKSNIDILEEYLAPEGELNEYGEVIKEAIQKLASNNPREIKRTMNTAFLKGYEASSNPVLSGDESLRFAQGVQVSLLQKYFQSQLELGSILVEDNVHQWFSNVSLLLRNNPDYVKARRGFGNLKRNIEFIEEIDPNKEKKQPQPKGHQLPEGVDLEKLHPPSAIQFKDLDKEWIVKLLWAIPFSTEVAASTAQKISKVEYSHKTDEEFEQFKKENPIILRAIARELDKKIDLIEQRDLSEVKKIDISNSRIFDISSLKELKSLTILNLSGNQISDIFPLQDLKSLTKLSFSGNQVSDISPLQELKSLTYLDLCFNQVSDISPIQELKSLTDLNFSRNQVSDISPLQELKSLTYLYFSENQVSDISPIQELKSLIYQNFSRNQVSDISPLQELKSLTYLYFSRNQVSDISPLQELKSLTYLYFSENQVSDISPLQELKSLTILNFSKNQVSDISPLQELKSLINLNFSENQVSDISPLQEQKSLINLNFSENQINKNNIQKLRKLLPDTEIKFK